MIVNRTRCLAVATGALLLGGTAFAQPQAPRLLDPWPSAETTGVSQCIQSLCGGSLTSASGMVVTQAGKTLQCLDVKGTIDVNADNVTIRCVRIDAQGAAYGLDAEQWPNANPVNTVAEDVEITNASSAGLIFGSRFTGRRMHIHDSVDGIKAAGGGPTLIEDSYVHNLMYLSANGGSHNDGVQCRNGSDHVWRHNKIVNQLTQTSAFLYQNTSTMNNITWDRNFLAGGAFSVYVTDKGGGAPTGITFTDNVWKKGSAYYDALKRDCGGSWTWRNNTYDDGSSIGNPCP